MTCVGRVVQVFEASSQRQLRKTRWLIRSSFLCLLQYVSCLKVPLPFKKKKQTKKTSCAVGQVLPSSQATAQISLDCEIFISMSYVSNISTHTHRNHVLPAIWASLNPVELTRELTITQSLRDQLNSYPLFCQHNLRKQGCPHYGSTTQL